MTTHDVVVVGGGPAGSIASLALKRQGFSVLLLEKGDSGRDKICGDGLIPDSLQLLGEMGLLEEVRGAGHAASTLQMYSPSGDSVRLKGDFVTLARSELDKRLRRAAEDAGVEVKLGVTATGMRNGDGAATVQTKDSGEFECRMVILATGADAGPLKRFGLQHRSVPSAIAGRAYYRLRDDVPEDSLGIWYERPVLPGYGWIFPMGDHVFNVGAGVFRQSGRKQGNLRVLFDRFVSDCPGAKDMMDGAEQLTEFRGAPLRCSLKGSEYCGDRLLATGETIGSTYALNGEGIGKAMQIAFMAAQVATSALKADALTQAELAGYRRKVHAEFMERFRQYQTAQSFLRFPWIVNTMIRSAHRNSRVRSVLEQTITERTSPSELLSVKGVLGMVLARNDTPNRESAPAV